MICYTVLGTCIGMAGFLQSATKIELNHKQGMLLVHLLSLNSEHMLLLFEVTAVAELLKHVAFFAMVDAVGHSLDLCHRLFFLA